MKRSLAGSPVCIVGLLSVTVLLCSCADPTDAFRFDPDDPAEGPGQMVGNGSTVTDGHFPGGSDPMPEPRQVATLPDGSSPPDCGADCLDYCESLELANPVNRGLCTSLWGVGLSHETVDKAEACRRVYADMVGRFPTRREAATCRDAPWSETVSGLIDDPAFVDLNQRRWADKLSYNNEAVSFIRIFDADELVGKLYEGLIPYDQFAAVVSAHPVLTRRHDTAGDRAEALFWLLMGRPPLGNERSDLARLYTLWDSGYQDHEQLDLRLPDAYIDYECIDDQGRVDEETRGECTSILWGYNQLILEPDLRAEGDDDDPRMWAGQLRASEWEKLQMPGRILSEQRAFWENAVDQVLRHYMGYNLGRQVPEVRDTLVEYFLEHDADIRSLHWAVATSVAYRQSAFGTDEPPYQWAQGPLKQVEAETWIDSIKGMTGYDLSSCDYRLPQTWQLERSDRLGALALLRHSNWQLDDEGRVRDDYRDLARSLGGCPRNDAGGRFKIISILTTAQQLNFVDEVCAPGLESDGGAQTRRLLPDGISADQAVDADLAETIVSYQTETFFGREMSSSERSQARESGEACARTVCNAEEFARPSCFALLSSSEMLFY